MEYQSGAVSPIESIQKGWDIIKNEYWVFFGMTAVMIVIIFVAAMILSFVERAITGVVSGIFGIAVSNAGDAAKASAIIIPGIISLFISIFTSIIVGTLTGALLCGLYSGLSRKANTGVVEFGDLFSGFQKIQACLIVAVVLSLIQFVVGVVFLIGGAIIGVGAISSGMLLRDGGLNPALFGGMLVGALVVGVVYLFVSLIINALTTFIYPLIGERDVSGGEAIMLSIKSGLSNLFGLILLLILTGLMIFGGFIALCVGALFVAPIVVASYFAAYQSVFGSARGGTFQTPPPPPSF